MKTKTVFVCEQCGFEYERAGDALKCEADHLGLTVEEKKEWEHLKRVVKHCSCVVSRTKNEKTERSYDEAIEALMQFEKKHNIALSN